MHGAISRKRTPIEWTRTGDDATHQTVNTTLYHLIAGLQDCIAADDDELLVAVVYQLIGTGRLRLGRDGFDNAELPPISTETSARL